jgi:hypothetical protein
MEFMEYGYDKYDELINLERIKTQHLDITYLMTDKPVPR